MGTVYFADKACETIANYYRVSRPIFSELIDNIQVLEIDGIPDDALLVSDLQDMNGLAVNGYLVEIGKFALVLSQEAQNILVVWEIEVRVVDD